MKATLADKYFSDYVVPRRHLDASDSHVFDSNRLSATRGEELPSWAYVPRPTAEELARREWALKEMLSHPGDWLA